MYTQASRAMRRKAGRKKGRKKEYHTSEKSPVQKSERNETSKTMENEEQETNGQRQTTETEKERSRREIDSDPRIRILKKGRAECQREPSDRRANRRVWLLQNISCSNTKETL